jgi:hypothetical protein
MPTLQVFLSIGSVSISASTASASALLTVLIVNNTGALAYIQFGTGTVAQGTPTATVNSPVVVPTNERMATICGPNATQVAVLLSTGSGTVMREEGDLY